MNYIRNILSGSFTKFKTVYRMLYLECRYFGKHEILITYTKILIDVATKQILFVFLVNAYREE